MKAEERLAAYEPCPVYQHPLLCEFAREAIALLRRFSKLFPVMKQSSPDWGLDGEEEIEKLISETMTLLEGGHEG